MIDVSPLFSPLQLKTIRLANRFVVPSMQRSRCRDGVPSAQVAEYYRRRAEGGFALVFGESCAVDHPAASAKAGCLRMNRHTIEGWRDCVRGVRDAGSHMFIQLWHEGAMRVQPATGPDAGQPSLSPSGLRDGGSANGREASIEELQDITAAYVRSALMAREIGAAGIELHGGHGFLLDQFFWAKTNRRLDHYGGRQLIERARYPVELVRAIREAVGDEMIISFRFSQWKELDYNAQIFETPADLKGLLTLLQGAGVDMFNVSTRRFYQPEWSGSDLSLAGWTASFADVPVMTVGGVGVDNDVLECLVDGKEARNDVEGSLTELLRRFNGREFDLVAVGRASLGDPEWVNKVARGQYDAISPFVREQLMRDMAWDQPDAEVAWARKDASKAP